MIRSQVISSYIISRIKVLLVSGQLEKTMTKLSFWSFIHIMKNPREASLVFELKNMLNFRDITYSVRYVSPGCQFPSPSVAAVWQSAELVISSAPNESRLGNDFFLGDYRVRNCFVFFSDFGTFLLDLLFCPFSLHFAAFWSWKLPFQRYCNILEFEPLIFHDICNILVLKLFILDGILRPVSI